MVTPAPLTPTGPGVTDFRLFRVIATLGATNIHLEGNAVTPPGAVPTVLRLVR